MPDVISHLRDAGFSDDEITAWSTDKRGQLAAGGFTDPEIDDYFGMPKTPDTIPMPLLDRIGKGVKFARDIVETPMNAVGGEIANAQIENVQGAVKNLLPKSLGGGREPGGESTGEGMGNTAAGLMYALGSFPPFAAAQGMIQAVIGHPLVATDEALRGGAVKLFGEDKVAEAERAAGEHAGGGSVGGMTLEEARGIANRAMMALGPNPLTRIGFGAMREAETVAIGGLPKGEDFSTAGKVLGNGDTTPAMEQKLADLYEEKGIHPAEVAHDAQSDPTITQSILSSDPKDMPGAYGPPPRPPEPPAPAGGAPPPYTDAEKQILSKISIGEESPTSKMTWNDLYTNFIDKLFPISKAVKDVGAELSAEDNPYQRARLLSGYVGKADHFLNNGTFDFTTYANNGPSLKEILRPVGDLNGFRAYATAQRAIELEGRGIRSGFAETGGAPPLISGRPLISKNIPNGLSLKIDKPSDTGVREFSLVDADGKQHYMAKVSSDVPALGKTAGIEWIENVSRKYSGLGPAFYKAIAAKVNEAGKRLFVGGGAARPGAEAVHAVLEKEGFATEVSPDVLPPEIAKEVRDSGKKLYEVRGSRGPEGMEAVRTVVADGAGKYEQPFRALVDYQNRVSQYLRDSGVLSDAGYKAMVEANKMYVPFSRVMGIDAESPHVGGSTLQAHNPIKAIKGSARDIIDPIESVIRNTYHFVEMAEKNVVGTKLVDMLANASKELPEAPGAVKAEVAVDAKATPAMKDALAETGIKNADDLAASLAHASAPVRQDEIAILRNGKRETYTVDADLARAMKGLDAQSMGVLERILSYPASLLRAGAVTTPDFAIRHTIRDFLYATTTFKGGVFTPIDMAKGFGGLIMKDEDYWNWLKGGGGNISLVGVDRRYMQEDLRKLTGETGLVGRAWNVIADPGATMWDKAGAAGKLPFQAIGKFVLDPLRLVTQFAENASHLGAFKKTMRVQEAAETGNLRSQIINAAWQSRDTAVDAARMGANMRAYNMITAFANIKLQDTDRVVRALKDNPIATITKIGGAITVPSVLLWAANHDDPRYNEIPQWQKDLFWIVMTPDHVFRVPKPWAMGQVFGTMPERLLQKFVDEKPDAFKDYFKDLWATSGPDFIPSAAAPIIDQFANRSTFTNRTLIPSEQEKFLPEYQYTPYTTELTKSLGKVIGAFPGMSELKMDNSGFGGTARALTSPILMENYIRGWSGTLGVYALNAVDAALRKAGALPDPPQPASTLADIPIVKAFVVRYPSASAESIQGFYDEYARNKAYFDTFMAKAKDGDIAATQHIQEMGGPMMFVQLDGIKSVLTEHSQLIRDLYKNPDVPPEEKRQLVDQLYFSMIQVAQHGNGVIKSLKDAATVRGALLPTTGLPEPATAP